MSAMMNRTLMSVPRRCQGVARVLPSASAIPRHTFLTYGRVQTLASSSHLSLEHQTSSSFTPSGIPTEEKEMSNPQQASESSQHVPWYLQEKSSAPAPAEVTSRDQLPELPENPPKILPELMEYVFKDLGLDELKFIDLRGMDTPAALGANVIMIIGSARSVKHLNVSADRFCRWLRSKHKLSPYADGLLGRNELKIKLRRKTRRARIASRTGSMVDDKDDGITTGWICVNAGVVEKSPVQDLADDGFEGFGSLVGGTRVVVQILTEEKRAELDIEGLWEGRITRAKREKEKHSDVAVDAPEEVRSPNSIRPPTSSSDYKFPDLPRSPVSLPFKQTRQFHSRSQDQGLSPWHNVTITRRCMSRTHALADPESSSSAMLLKDLSSLPDEQLKSALGDNPDDHNSTDFLRTFYNSLSDTSLDTLALAQLELMCFASSRGYTGYSRESIHRAFMGCCISACEISERLSNRVLDILLAPRTGGSAEVKEWFNDSDKEVALGVLNQLVLRGQDFMNLRMFTRLYSLASLPSGPEEDGINPADRGSHVLRMIEILNIPFDPVEARKLMSSVLRNGDFDTFWKWWRKLPLNNSPRTYDDYNMLFQLHAEFADERQARECLTKAVPMMSREDPPVLLEGELVKNIRDCLSIADPRVETQAAAGSKGPFAQLWRECESKFEG